MHRRSNAAGTSATGCQAAEHQPVDFATRADLAALEARLTWRFAGAMVAQTLTLIGAMVAIIQLIG